MCKQEEWPLLIVVPASLRLTWAEEIERWLPHLRPTSLHIIYSKAERLPVDSHAQVSLSREALDCLQAALASPCVPFIRQKLPYKHKDVEQACA